MALNGSFMWGLTWGQGRVQTNREHDLILPLPLWASSSQWTNLESGRKESVDGHRWAATRAFTLASATPALPTPSSFPHFPICPELLPLSSPPPPIPRDSHVPRPSSSPSIAFWAEKDPQAGVRVARLEYQRTRNQETWLPVPASSLLHSVTLDKSLPLKGPQHSHSSKETKGYLKALLAPKCSVSVSWPTVSKSQVGAHQSHSSRRGTGMTTSTVSIVGKVRHSFRK